MSLDDGLTVVGAGPVGLAAAIVARERGLEVRVLEQQRGPTLDKACGEGLMPRGVQWLQQHQITVAPEGRHDFTGIRWIDGDVQLEADFPHGVGWGVRRIWLHRALHARALALGVEFHWGTEVTELPTGWVLAADGLHSPLRRLAGLEAGPGPHRRTGIRRHFTIEPWTDRVEVYWGQDCEAYVTPVGPERVGIAFLMNGKGRFDSLLEAFPTLARRLHGAPVESKDRGAGPLHQRVKAVHKDQLALIGDAAGYLDAITGEGLSLGFRQAEAAVDAVLRGDLAHYGRAHRQLVRLPFALMDLLLFMERRPSLRSAVLRSMPTWIFGRLLKLNDG